MFGLWQVTRNASAEQSAASLLLSPASPSPTDEHATATSTAAVRLLLLFIGGDDGRKRERNPMDYSSEKFQFRLVAVDDAVSAAVARNLRIALPQLSAHQQRQRLQHQEQQQQLLGRHQNLIKRKQNQNQNPSASHIHVRCVLCNGRVWVVNKSSSSDDDVSKLNYNFSLCWQM
jgi:hypothetical protein